MPMLSVRELEAGYGPIRALDGASLEVDEGELVAIIGKVLPGCAVCEGIHAEGPIVADYGGLPISERVRDRRRMNGSGIPPPPLSRHPTTCCALV